MIDNIETPELYLKKWFNALCDDVTILKCEDRCDRCFVSTLHSVRCDFPQLSLTIPSILKYKDFEVKLTKEERDIFKSKFDNSVKLYYMNTFKSKILELQNK